MVLTPGSLSVFLIVPRLIRLKLGFTASTEPPITIFVAAAPAIDGWIASVGRFVVAIRVVMLVLSPGAVGPALRIPALTLEPIATADPDSGATCVEVNVAVPGGLMVPKVENEPLIGAVTRAPVMF